ncbi:MAG: SUMF1/EgtB/PvdO family nonheme iron enzyme, partial [Verrucomicrobia bacterium]|nr:SUMF1/EgtB/PvdO family nonheme iron enzyme [Verrucomicrobiota bacterium]
YVKKHGPLSPANALNVVLQVARALEAAQAQQLLHRDIKPGNIMAVTNRVGSIDVKLIDFGLAKAPASESPDGAALTQRHDFVGSPAFASPEQCQMKPLDTRSDLYSLGVTLWYLLSGKLPFTGTVGEIMIAQVVTPPPFDQLAQIPESVVALLRRMLAKNRDERFQTPEELQLAVEATLTRLASDSDVTSVRFAARAATAPAPVVTESASEPEPIKPVAKAAEVSASSGLDAYLAVDVGTLTANRYRLIREEREGHGGRFFYADDQKALPEEPTEVGLKLIHPSIASDPSLLDLIENEIEMMRQATHPHLVRYRHLDRSVPGPWLVREWLHGFLLFELLRWCRSLNASELLMLLEPLPATLDFVSSQGFRLVDVSLQKIFLACPRDVPTEHFRDLARASATGWTNLRLRLNPLSLALLLQRDPPDRGHQTLVPVRRGLAQTAGELGGQARKAIRLFARLIYELLSGHAPAEKGGQTAYTPLPELNQAANSILQRACAGVEAMAMWRSCESFWNAFKDAIVAGSAVPLSQGYGATGLPGMPAPSFAAPTAPPPLPRPLPQAPIKRESIPDPLRQVTTKKPWVNSLGMTFIPVPGTKVLFSIWNVRVRDFETFVAETGYDATAGMFSMGRNDWQQRGANWRKPGFTQGPDHPVVGISWEDAGVFCRWVTSREQAAGRLPGGVCYRLPTDREWSIAVGLDEAAGGAPREKSGKLKEYPWGRHWPPPKGVGNYFGEEAKIGEEPSDWEPIKRFNDGWPRTSPVGSFPANRLGLFDMGGNVWEWCEDWYDFDRTHRVLRGASWTNRNPVSMLSSFRYHGKPDYRAASRGFRCVLAHR